MSGFDGEFLAGQRELRDCCSAERPHAKLVADGRPHWMGASAESPFHWYMRQQERRKRRLLDREVQDYLDLHPHPRSALEYSDMVEEILRRLRSFQF